jgi:heat shock protein HslJ
VEGSFEGQPWVLVAGIPIPAEAGGTRPSALFADGRLGGSTGCNRYTTSYAADGHDLDLGQIATTLMACEPPAAEIEKAYVTSLARVEKWRLDDDQLILADAAGAELLRFAPASPIGDWQLTGVLRGDAIVSPLSGAIPTARFGDDAKLSGSAGCNNYFASYTSVRGSIEITSPAATRMACLEPAGVMEQEAAYLAALPLAADFLVDGDSLELLGQDGRRLVTYTRASPAGSS